MADSTAIEDGEKLEISNLGRKRDCTIYGADQVGDDSAADLRLCFCICKKQIFS